MNNRFKCVLLLLAIGFSGCKDPIVNPNAPHAYINFEVNLMQNDFELLNWAGNYVYVTSEPGSESRGIIIYRMPYNEPEFRVYDRFPPEFPYACCDDDGNCSRLVTDGQLVYDSCSNITYNILDGTVFEGDGRYELIQYRWSYNAVNNTLHVYN